MSSSFEPLCIFMCSCACLRTPSVPAHTYVFLCILCVSHAFHAFFTFSCILFLPFHLHMRLCISMFSFAFLYLSFAFLWGPEWRALFSSDALASGMSLSSERAPAQPPMKQKCCDWWPCLKKLCQVSTRLWNNFVWNNFQGIISSRGRYTMMHVGTFKIMIPPVKIPRNNWVLEKKISLKALKTSRKQLIRPTFGLALPKSHSYWRCLPENFCWKCKLQLFKASCSLGNCWPPLFAAYLQAQLVPNGPAFSHGTFSRELFGWQWKGNLRKCLGKARLSAILWAFPREKYSRVLEMPGTPQNESGQPITKLAQKLARIVKKQMEPKHFPPIPTMANGNFLEGNEGNMEKKGGRTQSWKTSRREPGWVHFVGFP